MSVSQIVARLRYQDFQIFVMCLAVALYACFGSPTPDAPGVLEAVIGGLLIIGVGVSGVRRAFDVSDRACPLWVHAGRALLLYGLSVSLLAGVMAGHGAVEIIRDMLPFLFMMLPLFFTGRAQAGAPLLWAVVVLGLVFSLRAQIDVPFLAPSEALQYLANVPSVLFAALFLTGLGLRKFAFDFNARILVVLLVCGGLVWLCLQAMADVQQRAHLGAYALYLVLVLLFVLIRAPRRGVFLCLGFAVFGFLFSDWVSSVFETLVHKSDTVGMNARFEEIGAVWGSVSAHVLSAIFGRGWGASFASPAVADIEIYYTHGLLSSLLLKNGLIGLVLGGVYIGGLLRVLFARLGASYIVVLALAAPILIDVFLYASFKSLDFGLVLLLAAYVSEGKLLGDDSSRLAARD